MGRPKPKVFHKMHVKAGDTVQVISGKEKGQISEILKSIPEKSQVIVKGVNIHSSKVMLYSKKGQVASRISYTFTAEGKKVRMLKKTGEIID
jgi:large subunit ribosomal protein L24